MEIIYWILMAGTILLGIVLVGIGLWGFIKKESYAIVKQHIFKVKGKQAFQWSLYYLGAGILWLVYFYMRLNE